MDKKLWKGLVKELEQNVKDTLDDSLREMYCALLVAEKGEDAKKELDDIEFSIAKGTLVENGFLD
jgi:hypothetical protein